MTTDTRSTRRPYAAVALALVVPLVLALVLLPFRAHLENTHVALLSVVVVVAVAAFGRRPAGYLAGIQAAADTGAAGGSSRSLIQQVAAQLIETLGLDEACYQPGVAGVGQPARLRRDGEITRNGALCDVDRDGLPAEIEILVESGGLLRGRYLLRAAPRTFASLEQRRVAVTLVDQVGAAR